MPDHLSFPDEDASPRQDEQGDGANGVEDIRDAHRIDPSRHSKHKDRAEHIPQERERGERVSDNFCKRVSNHCLLMV
jgi:hypothetical protein